MNISRHGTIAVVTALLGGVSFATAALLFTSIPDTPPGDGFAAGLTGIFVIVFALIGVLTLGEAGLLVLVTSLWNPAEQSRRLLTTGAVAGSLSVVLLAGPILVGRLSGMLVTGFAWITSVGLLFVQVGIVCSGLGIVFRVVNGPRA